MREYSAEEIDAINWWETLSKHTKLLFIAFSNNEELSMIKIDFILKKHKQYKLNESVQKCNEVWYKLNGLK